MQIADSVFNRRGRVWNNGNTNTQRQRRHGRHPISLMLQELASCHRKAMADLSTCKYLNERKLDSFLDSA